MSCAGRRRMIGGTPTGWLDPIAVKCYKRRGIDSTLVKRTPKRRCEGTGKRSESALSSNIQIGNRGSVGKIAEETPLEQQLYSHPGSKWVE